MVYANTVTYKYLIVPLDANPSFLFSGSIFLFLHLQHVSIFTSFSFFPPFLPSLTLSPSPSLLLHLPLSLSPAPSPYIGLSPSPPLCLPSSLSLSLLLPPSLCPVPLTLHIQHKRVIIHPGFISSAQHICSFVLIAYR